MTIHEQAARSTIRERPGTPGPTTARHRHEAAGIPVSAWLTVTGIVTYATSVPTPWQPAAGTAAWVAGRGAHVAVVVLAGVGAALATALLLAMARTGHCRHRALAIASSAAGAVAAALATGRLLHGSGMFLHVLGPEAEVADAWTGLTGSLVWVLGAVLFTRHTQRAHR